MDSNAINPSYYTQGFEFGECRCIIVIRELPFSLGSAVKYIWRAGDKDEVPQEIEKARWYITDARTHPRVTPAMQERALTVLGMIKTDNLSQGQLCRLFIIQNLIGGDYEKALSHINKLNVILQEQHNRGDNNE